MEITLKNLQKKIPIPRRRVLKAAKAALKLLRGAKRRSNLNKPSCSFRDCFGPKSGPRNDAGGLSIVFVGTKRMRAVNKKYLNHDYVTDVLSFNLGGTCGEIIICPHMACANAKAHQTSTDNEIILYVIHGILHLAGFNDQDPLKKIRMQRMENKILWSL